MIQLKKAVVSSLGQKFLMALSGLGLVVFVIVHLLGNLALYRADGSHFNAYAAKLDSFGALLTFAEIGLLFTFLLHILTGLGLKKNHMGARPSGYRMWKSKVPNVSSTATPEVLPSTSSSRYMIVSGLILLGFLILHIWQFRFGPGIKQGYAATVSGEQVQDLHRLVVETFHNPIYVWVYVGAMVFLGFHLRHGFWSAFQSLGVNHKRTTSSLYAIGWIVACALMVGFLLIPIWIYYGLSGG